MLSMLIRCMALPRAPWAVAALAILAGGEAAAAVVVPTGFADEIVVSNLAVPNSMAFLPDGRVLITEQFTGRIRVISVAKGKAATLPSATVANLTISGGERGLQGIAVDPGWPARPYVYVYYTHSGGHSWVVRYTASGALTDPLGEDITLANPLTLIDDIPDVQSVHNAGGVRFGPEGRLFVTVGDDADPCGAADSTLLKGALLRLDVSRLPESSASTVPRALIVPPTHALASADSNAMLVWAYGMRNPWRYVFDPVSGACYLADVGEDDFEEIDEVLPGDFLGWPWREGFLEMVRATCPEPGGQGANDYKGPILARPHGGGGAAIITAGMYRPVAGAHSNWPSEYWGFYGDVFYGDYYLGHLRRLKKQSGIWITPPPVPGQPNADDWATGLTSASDMFIGPDGSLWWLQQYDATFGATTGSLHRIRNTDAVTGVPDRPAAARTLVAAPALFATATELRFALERPARARLAVYDVAGREVRRLLDGAREAGETRVAWDGRDAEGAIVPSGVYLARLVTGDRVERARLIRVR